MSDTAGRLNPSGTSSSLIEISHLDAYYGESQILFDLSLAFGNDEVIGIFGRNGMGKTTLLRSIVNQIGRKSGTIEFRDDDITDWSTNRIIRNGIAYVPEDRSIYPNMTVEENLRLACPRSVSKAEYRDRLDRIYSRFERLDERQEQEGGTLSGGEQQMLAIARGLITDPDLLLLDEPTEGLAPVIINDVVNIIENLASQDRAIVLVEQNIKRTLSLIDRGYILENGKIVVEGDDKCLDDDELHQKYLTV